MAMMPSLTVSVVPSVHIKAVFNRTKKSQLINHHPMNLNYLLFLLAMLSPCEHNNTVIMHNNHHYELPII